MATSKYPNPYESSWDEESQKWVNANLIGLPYDKMVQNGEGNRHAGEQEYYRLILVHALFASFAFLIFTPAALICARFLIHGPHPRLAMGGHVGFQIASVLCLTITFITGYFAVGQENWGKNPHHIIGATVYGGMLFQAFFGAFVRWKINKQIRKYIPLHLMVHQWLGRGVFLLGLAQIPLGLYVYGSPLTLFILYAVLVFLFLVTWFLCEYLQERGYFTHGSSNQSIHSQIPEMTESRRRSPVTQNPGYEPGVAVDYQPLQTPKKSRFSKLSWFSRNRQPSGETAGFRYGDLEHTEQQGAPSIDTSRAASAQMQSPAIGGLYPAPHRPEDAPPVPPLPANLNTGSGSFRYSDNEPTSLHPPLHDSALRNSTTLGTNPPLQMPEPFSPVSPTSPGQYHNYPTTPPYNPTPPSNSGGSAGYTEQPTGFLPSPVAAAAPIIPLPARPHRRDRSSDSTPRRSASRDRQNPLPTSPTAGGDHPNIAVQVKLNPDKSVSVRRLQPEEAERQRREHARARQERARDREIALDRERREARRQQSVERKDRENRERQEQEQVRLRQEEVRRREEEQQQQKLRLQQQHQQQQQQQQQQQHQQAYRQEPLPTVQPLRTGDRRSQVIRRENSFDSGGEQLHLADSLVSLQPPGSYTPSLGGQSSTIENAAGGLLGRPMRPDESPSPDRTVHPGYAASPLIGLTPMRPPVVGGGGSYGGGVGVGGQGQGQGQSGFAQQRTSVASGSGTVTAENSEMEQEIVKEQRRKKRREERGRGEYSEGDEMWT